MKRKILTVISVLLGLMMVNSGFNKFFNYMPMPDIAPEALEVMTSFFNTGWLMQLVAVAEIVGGVLFAIPKLRALGAVVLFPIIVGIVLFHGVNDPANVGMSFVFLGINVWAILENKSKFVPLIK